MPYGLDRTVAWHGVETNIPSDAAAFAGFALTEREERATDFSDADSFFNLPADDDEDDEDDDPRR